MSKEIKLPSKKELKWRCPITDTPPENTELLVKTPYDVYHVAYYRPAYRIFDFQSKSESMLCCKYFVIDDLNQNKDE